MNEWDVNKYHHELFWVLNIKKVAFKWNHSYLSHKIPYVHVICLGADGWLSGTKWLEEPKFMKAKAVMES